MSGKERLEKINLTTSAYLDIIQRYLPKQIPDEEILTWIKNNVDFTKLKNKLQAVGMVTKHFGAAVNGKEVQRIISNMG